MSFGESIRTCLVEKYADFSGRARRSEYWWFYLAQIIIMAILYAIAIAPLLPDLLDGDDPEFSGTVIVGLVLLIVVGLALIIPSIAVAVRRLHDTDKSGAYYFINFVPYVGSLIFIIFVAIEGTPGPNQYGPDPKAA